jgi:hypothetical protein
MYQDIARALRDISTIDPYALMRTAYQALLSTIDAGLVSDGAEDDDLQMGICGQCADWLQTQLDGRYPTEPQRQRIAAFVELLVDGLWNHQFGRSIAVARDQQNEVMLAMKMILSTPEPRPVMGRPSQGRSHRIAAMISEDLFAWLDAQRGPRESMSDAIYRLLNTAKNGEQPCDR